LTIIADWESGRVLGVVEGRSYKSLRGFFVCLSDTERSSIEAVAMDMWDPSIKLEGINNKIKVIKHKAYGFNDTEYFFW
jgi:transposase